VALLLLLGIVAAPACGGGGGGGPGGGCLSDQEICQFQTGVSTTADVRAAIGAPQMTQIVGGTSGGLQQWIYICQQTAQMVDLAQFVFDENGVLFGISVIRSGPSPRPAPTCL
jgi:hypothetical protein